MDIRRDFYLEKLIKRKSNGLIKVITGIRRCGKSYLLNNIFYHHLLDSGVEADHIIRFAFDSADDLYLIGESLIQIEKEKRGVDPEKFMAYIRSKTTGEGIYYLLLDEIQMLDCFEAVLNGYLRKENIDVFVTGSNAKLLSKDIATEFAGRGDEIHNEVIGKTTTPNTASVPPIAPRRAVEASLTIAPGPPAAKISFKPVGPLNKLMAAAAQIMAMIPSAIIIP